MKCKIEKKRKRMRRMHKNEQITILEMKERIRLLEHGEVEIEVNSISNSSLILCCVSFLPVVFCCLSFFHFSFFIWGSMARCSWDAACVMLLQLEIHESSCQLFFLYKNYWWINGRDLVGGGCDPVLKTPFVMLCLTLQHRFPLFFLFWPFVVLGQRVFFFSFRLNHSQIFLFQVVLRTA